MKHVGGIVFVAAVLSIVPGCSDRKKDAQSQPRSSIERINKDRERNSSRGEISNRKSPSSIEQGDKAQNWTPTMDEYLKRISELKPGERVFLGRQPTKEELELINKIDAKK